VITRPKLLRRFQCIFPRWRRAVVTIVPFVVAKFLSPVGIIYVEMVSVRTYIFYSSHDVGFIADTFICDKCEAKEVNIQSPDETYDLVRCQLLTPNNDSLTKKERLANLEERFMKVDDKLHQLDSKVDSRLRRVEELLHFLVHEK
jgi:hypothetical protein